MRITRKIQPPPFIPKFQPGQRVKASAEAVRWGTVPADTTGTVEFCSDVFVRVVLDPSGISALYSPDFWDAIPGKKAAASDSPTLF